MRLRQIDTPYHWLVDGDRCYHYGDYTAEGGYDCSETNRWITNLKKAPTVPARELHWKNQAIAYWGNILRSVLPPENIRDRVTLVAMPGSKPAGHVAFDPRMLGVLTRYAAGLHGIDIRSLLHQVTERPGQHVDRRRLSPDEIIAGGLEVDQSTLGVRLNPIVLVVDDVITMGATFKAAQQLISPLPGVQSVRGIFLAKTVWVPPDYTALFGSGIPD